MKIWKKNLIAAAVLVTVCAGIYVNWLYAKGQATQTLTESLDTEKVMGEDTLELTDDMVSRIRVFDYTERMVFWLIILIVQLLRMWKDRQEERADRDA